MWSWSSLCSQLWSATGETLFSTVFNPTLSRTDCSRWERGRVRKDGFSGRSTNSLLGRVRSSTWQEGESPVVGDFNASANLKRVKISVFEIFKGSGNLEFRKRDSPNLIDNFQLLPGMNVVLLIVLKWGKIRSHVVRVGEREINCL